MDFSRLELLHLRRIVVDDIEAQRRRIQKYSSWAMRDDAFQEKMALAQSEFTSMVSICRKIDEEISVRNLLSIPD